MGIVTWMEICLCFTWFKWVKNGSACVWCTICLSYPTDRLSGLIGSENLKKRLSSNMSRVTDIFIMSSNPLQNRSIHRLLQKKICLDHGVNSISKFFNSNDFFLPWIGIPESLLQLGLSWKKYFWIKRLNGELICGFNSLVGNFNSKFINCKSTVFK